MAILESSSSSALGGYFIWKHYHQSRQPPAPVYESYTESHSADGVQQAAKQSGVVLRSATAKREIVQAIQDSDTPNPDAVVQTTGAQLTSAVKTEQVKTGATLRL